jgi:hypothetical protein
MAKNYDWIQDLILDQLYHTLIYAVGAGQTVEQKIHDYLAGLPAGKVISESPLVQVVEVNGSLIALLVRGWVAFFSGKVSAFMRIEVVLDNRDPALLTPGAAVQIAEWRTIVGELKLSKPGVFDASVALGCDKGIWSGRGAMHIEPAQIGVDIELAGLDSRGAVVGLDVEFPVAIPLGSTGLGLRGLGGDYAYNFMARLRELPANEEQWELGQATGNPPPATQPPAHPDARHYIQWAREFQDPDRWQIGPPETTAVGVGIRADLVTMFDNGWIFKLKPLGFAVLTPGPVFVLGGVGTLLSTDAAKVYGYLALDIATASLAIGFGVQVKVPASNGKLLEGSGTLDALFSFSDPSLWFINLGTERRPVKASLLSGFLRGEVFFMIDNHRVRFGATVSIEWDASWWKIRAYVRLGAGFVAELGWNPFVLAAMIKVFGECGIELWCIKLSLRLEARAMGYLPDPLRLAFEFRCTIGLPWPIPDISFNVGCDLGDPLPKPPAFSSPLLAGTATVEGNTTTGTLKLGALHALTGRQWDLGTSEVWPDMEIVVPFGQRVIDWTGVVLGDAVEPPVQGGYVVYHELKKLELRNLVTGKLVPQIQAVWGAGPGGETARLHVLAQDPFLWLTPHGKDTTSTVVGAKFVEQNFGFGPAEPLTGEQRFGGMIVAPEGAADLISDFEPTLPTRLLSAHQFHLHFRMFDGRPYYVDRLTLIVLLPEHVDRHHVLDVPAPITQLLPLYGGLRLATIDVPMVDSLQDATITSGGGPEDRLLVFAVRFRQKLSEVVEWHDKPVLVPGRYRITLEGQSVARNPANQQPENKLPDSKTVAWRTEQDFGVKYPESLRPYIHYSTLGDYRLFATEGLPWNPSTYGIGFPAYQGYTAAVRFKVPYLASIFDRLKLRLQYERGAAPPTVTGTAPPQPNAANESCAPRVSQQWILNAGQAVKPDQEVIFPCAYPASGPAAFSLLFDTAEGQEVRLDQWGCYISRFLSFQEHLEWTETWLETGYGPAGRQTMPAMSIVTGFVLRGAQPSADEVGPPAPPPPMPRELTEPPDDWLLPSSLVQPFRAEWGARSFTWYGTFAMCSGASFGPQAGSGIAEVNNLVSQTTVESVLDGAGNVLALWLRTPEPVDWRRVSATLVIQYPNRQPIPMNIAILPSPDGSSAFLAGVFANQFVQLPCGQYELSFTFASDVPGLVKLRPGPGIPAIETATLRFYQPSGVDWPTAEAVVVVDHERWLELAQDYHIPLPNPFEGRVEVRWTTARIREISERYGIPLDAFQRRPREGPLPTRLVRTGGGL